MKKEEERQAGKSPFSQVKSHCPFYSEGKQSSHTWCHLSFLQEPVLTWSQGTVFRLEEDHEVGGGGGVRGWAVVPRQNFCLLMSSTMVMSTGSVKYILCKMRQLWAGGNNDRTELSKDQMRSCTWKTIINWKSYIHMHIYTSAVWALIFFWKFTCKRIKFSHI